MNPDPNQVPVKLSKKRGAGKIKIEGDATALKSDCDSMLLQQEVELLIQELDRAKAGFTNNAAMIKLLNKYRDTLDQIAATKEANGHIQQILAAKVLQIQSASGQLPQDGQGRSPDLSILLAAAVGQTSMPPITVPPHGYYAPPSVIPQGQPPPVPVNYAPTPPATLQQSPATVQQQPEGQGISLTHKLIAAALVTAVGVTAYQGINKPHSGRIDDRRSEETKPKSKPPKQSQSSLPDENFFNR